MSRVIFEMNLYVMILVKIRVICRNLFGGTLFLQPTDLSGKLGYDLTGFDDRRKA